MKIPSRSKSCAVALGLGVLGALPGPALAGPLVSTPFELEIGSMIQHLSGSASSGVSVTLTASATNPADGNGLPWYARDYIEDPSVWVAPRYLYPAPQSPSVPADCSFDRPSLCSYIWYDPTHTSDGGSGVTTAYFRTTFNLPRFEGAAFPFGAILRVRADDDFAVWINGFLVMLDSDFGEPGDRGADHVFERPVSSYLRMDDTNVIAFIATDGNLFSPSDVSYEHLAFELKLNDLPEPASAALALLGLGGLAGLRRRRR